MEFGCSITAGKCDPGDPKDFQRREAITNRVVQEEVVQFVRPDDLLGLLGDLTGFIRRQQFGA